MKGVINMTIDKQLIAKNVDQLNAFEKTISAWSFDSRAMKIAKAVVLGFVTLMVTPLLLWAVPKGLTSWFFWIFVSLFAWVAYRFVKALVIAISPSIDTQAFILDFLQDYQKRALHPSAMWDLKANIKDMGFIELNALQHWVQEEREYILQMSVHANMNKYEQKTQDFLNG
jgi:hypothetical protein